MNDTNIGAGVAIDGAYGYRTHRWRRFGGTGSGLYGPGYGNGGHGYGAYGNGYGNGYGGYGYRNPRYLRVYIPGLGWVLVPRPAARRGVF
jgi:hypothetical protein